MTKLTKQHYEALASMVRGLDVLSPFDKLAVATQLADVCQTFNPRFDRQKFLKACGVK